MLRDKKELLFSVCFLVIICLCSCSFNDKSSSFNIQFIDVGQGDAALIECDGHYMLIDGGNKSAGKKIRNVLVEKGIQKLDILAISHMHDDHIGGLPEALQYASSIKKTICNVTEGRTDAYKDLEDELCKNGATITVPHIGDTLKLGSAVVEVVDVASGHNNDSMVLMITYGKTSFLFTGDIEDNAQKRIYEKYMNDEDEPENITLMKIPHHGADSNTLYAFLRTFMPEYVVISVGKNNGNGHPTEATLSKLSQLYGSRYDTHVLRTDDDGDIFVKSNGKSIYIETSK